jgi:hypothetical protein
MEMNVPDSVTRDTDMETTFVMEPGRKNLLLLFIFYDIPANVPVLRWRRRPMAVADSPLNDP